MKEKFKILIAFVLGYIPVGLVLSYGFITSVNVDLNLVNGVIATNGIILGFWAAFIAIPRRENTLIWKRREMIEAGTILTLTSLLCTIFALTACIVGLLPSMSVLFMGVLSFYFVCWVLGITLHYTVFEGKRNKTQTECLRRD